MLNIVSTKSRNCVKSVIFVTRKFRFKVEYDRQDSLYVEYVAIKKLQKNCEILLRTRKGTDLGTYKVRDFNTKF